MNIKLFFVTLLFTFLSYNALAIKPNAIDGPEAYTVMTVSGLNMRKSRQLDIIVYQHTMTEGCGVCWDFSLFLSQGDQSLELKSTATDCSCM